MKQNKKPETLTLTLPFVDFTGTDKSSNKSDSYDSDGVFFVHDKNGEFLITQVNKEEGYAWINPLPSSVNEHFFKQTIEFEQADEFKQLGSLISDLGEHLAGRLSMMSDSTEEKLNYIINTTSNIEEGIEKLPSIEEHLSSIKSESDHPKGGYVDQDTLLQIIKEVKR
jgi:hypothetical protein